MVREILREEMGIQVRRTRFVYKGYNYPIHVVVFEREKYLGYFDADSYHIGIHKQIMYTAKQAVLRDLLRHELAHYFAFIDYGQIEHAHGPEFKEVCERFGFKSEVSRASVDIGETNMKLDGDLESERVIQKVRKLLSLSASSNSHEAQLATLKANQLLLKHNLNFTESVDDQELVVKKIYEQKRRDGKMQSLYTILQSFMVHPVYNYGRGKVYIEVTGTKSNVSLAQYICDFLSHELPRLWEAAKGANPELRGITHKNSFFIGLSDGYKSKLETVMSEYSPCEKKALIKIQNRLDEKIKLVYRRLSHTSLANSFNNESHTLGVEAGKKLTIHRGIDSKNSTRLHLLT
jgi:hypothetical protein